MCWFFGRELVRLILRGSPTCSAAGGLVPQSGLLPKKADPDCMLGFASKSRCLGEGNEGGRKGHHPGQAIGESTEAEILVAKGVRLAGSIK